MQFSSITIIYNPHSTGDSKAMAMELEESLQNKLPGIPLKTVATKYAGHAQKLARDIAKGEESPLIVSSSGDGGYHEVINGVMESGNKQAICAVLPAGNANDHARAMQAKPLDDQIVSGRVTQIDLIKVVSTGTNGHKTTEFAHAYVGLGLTPIVAIELNKKSLTALKELQIIITTFFKYRPFKIEHESRDIKLDSLLFANINRMAKVLTLAPENNPHDGKFEVIQFAAGHKWQLLKKVAQATAAHLDNPRQLSTYNFRVLKKMPIQMDGEVRVLEAQSSVSVSVAARQLRTIA